VANADWDSLYCPQAVSIQIVCQTGAPAAHHLFLTHPWCVRDLDRGIARGVLTPPSIEELLHLVRAQDVEEEIKCAWYVIGVMGESATRLRLNREEPRPLRKLIFLNREEDIRERFIANNGHDPLDLMVLESPPEDGEDGDETRERSKGRHPFFDREVWDDLGGAEYATQEMQEEEE